VAEVLKALPVSGVQGEATARPATSPKTSGGRVAGYTLLGVGGALLAGGGVVGVVSWKQYHDTKTTLATTAVKDLDSRKRAIQTETRVADILYAVGGVAAGVGLVLALVSPPSSSPAPPSTTVGFSTLPGGGALTVAGGF
jgi:hypothetical protein